MKAIVYRNYGLPDVLKLEDVAKPTPKENEVLVKVYAVSVNLSDWEGLRGKPFYARFGGLFKPSQQILGSDIAGRVDAVGKNVTQFKTGDDVFGLMWGYKGGFAEFACAPEKALALKPASMTFEQACTFPQAAVIALQGIREQGKVRAGQKVLINGAGGGAGSFAIRLAKIYGAEVTGVDNTHKLDFMRSLGADYVIDYTKTDFTRTGQAYDLILDLVAHRSASDYERALAPNGSYLAVGGSFGTLLQILVLGSSVGRKNNKKIRVLAIPPSQKDMLAIIELFEAGKMTPTIERTFSLSQVPEALTYLGEGRVKGKVVITVA